MEKRTKKVLRVIGGIAITLSISAVAFCALIIEPNFKINGLQTLNETSLNNLSRTVTLLDNNGNENANVLSTHNQIYTSIDKIPSHTINAFVSTEDKRFFKHNGLDYYRMLGAIKNNILSKSFKEGASTITQQLVKNTHLSNEKTLLRKMQEIRIARAVERKYDKNKILEMYLNVLYFGNNIYGIGTASKNFFDKDVSSLSIDESATLAGIINNPSKYNPYKNYDNCIKRRNTVLSRMKSNKKISNDEYQKAVNCKTKICKTNRNENQFVSAVIDQACNILNCNTAMLFSKKLTIHTTYSEHINNNILQSMRDIVYKNGLITHIIIENNTTGEVVADYNSSNTKLTNFYRQPGSTIKPFICYAPALESNAIYSCSQILDEPTIFGNYSPKNYKNNYSGYVSIKNSLSNSLNIPAVKLLDMCGIDYAKSVAIKSGFSFDKNDNSLPLALGGMTKGATLLQIVGAYQTLANYGKHATQSYITKIIDSNGKILFHNKPKINVAMRDDTAFLITDMLKDCANNGTANKVKAHCKDFDIAAKTGTVGNKNGNSDAYCIAYSPDYTVGVWIGNYKATELHNAYGGEKPAVIAGKILSLLGCKKQFYAPSSIVYRDIDVRKLNANQRVMLAGYDVPQIYRSRQPFYKKNIPKSVSYENNYEIFSPDFLPDGFIKNFEIL